MSTYKNDSVSNVPDDATWITLYQLLSKAVYGWVRSANVPVWKRQQYDVAEDLVQIAMEKVFKYLSDERKQDTPIHSLERLSLVIAKRCFIDMRRRELRLLHFPENEMVSGGSLLPELLVDPSLEVEEKIYEEWLMGFSARTIAAFSTKLRAAILADLANRSFFEEEPTVLQQAFLAVGISLRDYQCAPSLDPVERGRQSALRSLAYKRISQANGL
ncbi:MAG TPA: hypothetical protein VFN35_22800 [Ktedonobacteraceae bacterium]|nr:hypothetical protein [Ktedonobacteraceae bacterium]